MRIGDLASIVDPDMTLVIETDEGWLPVAGAEFRPDVSRPGFWVAVLKTEYPVFCAPPSERVYTVDEVVNALAREILGNDRITSSSVEKAIDSWRIRLKDIMEK